MSPYIIDMNTLSPFITQPPRHLSAAKIKAMMPPSHSGVSGFSKILYVTHELGHSWGKIFLPHAHALKSGILYF